jgi:pSer/pThr/pTyr-binding forkhead associated (FHA) protein
MENSFGKLVLINPNGPDQEFELAKENISIGRSLTNDLALDDARISRFHAKLNHEQKGLTLVDLGSSNGTVVNGTRIERVTLVPGDVIEFGSQQLKYSVDDPSEDVGLTVIDTSEQLDQTVVDEFLPVVINETTTPSLVVHTGDKTWSIDLEDLDQVTIGRDENCDVFIDAENISRRHAEVQQRGEAYLLKDLDSANGIWMDQQKIDEHVLGDGDVFRIGSAQIIFKQGFEEQALTLMEDTATTPKGRRTVVFVPGLMGSELWLGNERVWPNVKTLFTNPEIFAYGSDIPLEPRNIVDEVVIVPNLIKQDQYNRMGDYLVDELSFRRSEDFFEFPYDWRQDVRISARQLGQFIEGIPREQPIAIVAHSLGTYLTRYYLEVLGADKRVERAILMGGPYKGAVKGLVSMLVAPDVLPFGIMGERLRNILMSFPTSFQIMPDYVVGTDQNGVNINFFEEESWLDPEYLPLLKLAREFRGELKPGADIPTISIFGYGINTVASVSIKRDASGKLEEVSYQSEKTGDGSVLEHSAVLQGSEIHPVHQHHGALFVDNDVKMRLKIELMRPY